MMRARVFVLVASLAALLLFAVPALAAPDGPPVRFYALSKIDRSAGPVTMFSAGWTGKIVLRFLAELGTAPFVFPETNRTTTAIDRVFSSFDGSSFTTLTQSPTSDLTDARAVRGGITHLDEYQAYRKRSPDATLRITISQAILRAIDERRDAAPCPPKTVSDCPLLRGVVLFRARAYANSVGGDFFTEGGVAYLEGHRGHWTVNAATDADSRTPLWDGSNFRHSGDRARASVELRDPVALTVPLDSVRENELFAVHVTLESMAINDRGGESTSMAFINDPEHVGPALLKPQGLKPLGKPRLHEPKGAPLPAAQCPRGPHPSAGQLQLSRDAYAVTEADRNPMVLVTRTGGSRGAASVTVATSGGTARSGTDFKPTRTLVRFGNRDTSPRLVEIPIVEDRAAERSESFTVSLARARCSKLRKQKRASVTILDDDQPPPPPPPTFTIGGTVDGLQGSGLVLSNLGAEASLTANGSFTFPGTATSGRSYGVNVKAQPRNPDQVCTVQNGGGHVGAANVTNIAVHCQLAVTPSGLDSSFGHSGRVTTPGLGDGDAVLIQPDGDIVTVGPREVGNNFHFQFGATRHDAAGNLDTTFGTGGIVTTGFGGNDDKAFDAGLLGDGGFVAVGQADPAGLANTDFGIVRYSADGHPNPAFGTGGLVRSDLFGRDDVAKAVVVQPDGKIVAAGLAETTPFNFDFALVRYNPDGTLDHSFGGDGIVTTDLGTSHEGISDVALQPDGKIVVVGSTDQDAVLARYNPNGTLDPTFGGSGTVIGGIHTNVVNGVVVAPGGTILIAGTRGGDPIVASYSPDGRLNLGFGSAGVAQANIGGTFDSGDDLVVKPGGDIVLVGSASSATVSDMALVRFKPDGTLDTFVAADLSGIGDFGHALAIDSEGRIVAAGSAGDEFGLMRANL